MTFKEFVRRYKPAENALEQELKRATEYRELTLKQFVRAACECLTRDGAIQFFDAIRNKMDIIFIGRGVGKTLFASTLLDYGYSSEVYDYGLQYKIPNIYNFKHKPFYCNCAFLNYEDIKPQERIEYCFFGKCNDLLLRKVINGEYISNLSEDLREIVYGGRKIKADKVYHLNVAEPLKELKFNFPGHDLAREFFDLDYPGKVSKIEAYLKMDAYLSNGVYVCYIGRKIDDNLIYGPIGARHRVYFEKGSDCFYIIGTVSEKICLKYNPINETMMNGSMEFRFEHNSDFHLLSGILKDAGMWCSGYEPLKINSGRYPFNPALLPIHMQEEIYTEIKSLLDQKTKLNSIYGSKIFGIDYDGEVPWLIRRDAILKREKIDNVTNFLADRWISVESCDNNALYRVRCDAMGVLYILNRDAGGIVYLTLDAAGLHSISGSRYSFLWSDRSEEQHIRNLMGLIK